MSKKISRAMNVATGYADGGAPDEARMKRRIANQSLAGRDLTYEQMQYLADAMPEKEARSAALGELGAEITGIPSIVRGSGNVMRGIEERDPIRGAGGVLEAGIGMVPYAGALGRIPAAVAGQAFKTVPRTAAVLGTSAALNAYPDDAAAADKSAAGFIANDSEVKALQIEKQKAMEAFAKINQQHARSGPETQRQALKPYQDELKRINDKLEKAEDRARQQFKDQATFRENYPGVPQAMFGAGLGLAGGMPLMKGIMERIADRTTRAPAIEKAMQTAKTALDGPGSDAAAAAAQTILRNKLAAWDRTHNGVVAPLSHVGAGMKGALYGAEASQLPEQLDYISHEPGHPAREAAVKQFANPDYWRERIGPAAIGFGVGMTGSLLPGMMPKNKEFLAEAREVASRGQPPSAFQSVMQMLTGKKALGPTEAAIEDVRRYRNAAGMPATPPAATSTPNVSPAQGGAMSPSAGVAAGPVAPPASSSGPLQGMGPAAPIEPVKPSLVDRMRAQDQSLGPVAQPNQSPAPTSEAPRIVTRVKTKKGNYTHHDEKGLFTSNPKSKKDTDGHKYGGVVGKALRIARAMGGRVHTGPILQRADGGRTDTVPMDVPAGSYVIPADIISALGEGDTAAGMKSVSQMFGPHDEKGAKETVPIIAAGGEFVLSPSQVARIAGGDMSKAHAMLDQWVKATRAKHIETLANLPGPER